MQVAIYDKIGSTYDITRQPDPEIVSRIISHLSPTNEGFYLDVGCGSGNYTQAIFQKGFNISGLDISQEMRGKAKKKNNQIQWILGDARNLPFENNSFDGAICILATHHIDKLKSAFQEVFRVLKKGNFVILTSFPNQMQKYWLNEYFPNQMKKACDKMKGFEDISQILRSAQFQNIRADKFFVTNELKDLFLNSGKYRPEMYLDPIIRSGISTFALDENQEKITKGLEHLQKDILSGKIESIIQSYESDLGDYAFVVCNKV